MRLKWHAAAAVLLVFGVLVAAPASAHAQKKPAKPAKWTDQPLSDELVDEAIAKAIKHIWSQQDPKEFSWEGTNYAQWKKEFDPKVWTGYNGPGCFTGGSALTLLALTKAGESQEQERFRKAMEFIAQIQPTQTYARGLRAALWSSLDPFKARTELMKQEGEWLLNAAYADGTFGYYSPPNMDIRKKLSGPRDLSNTQYGILGLWFLSDAGAEIPDSYWETILKTLCKLQCDDGGWGYGIGPNQKSTHSMTMAAMASLFLVWDKLYTQRCDQKPDPAMLHAIRRGGEWMNKQFAAVPQGEWRYYAMYGTERVGVASGMKYLGGKNWYDQGARFLLWSQKDNGSWDPMGHNNVAHKVLNTCYALLFLSYGRAPVVFNKLAYGDLSNWDSRPRDLARLTAWMGKRFEKLFNWQVMPIDRPIEELRDAPILLMSGRQAIQLNDEQKDKLREYTLGGGLLLGEAADNNTAFVGAFRKLMTDLFPELEMVELPKDHPIYTVQFPLGAAARGQRPLPAMFALSNGIRTMALLSTGDLGCTWQRHDVVRGEAYFNFAANLMQYVSDRGTGLRGRGQSYMTLDEGFKPAATITVGRLVWGSKWQWNPEPQAWKRMDIVLRNAHLAGVATKDLDFKAAVNPADVPLVHLTGVGPIVLTEEQQKNLQAYLKGGGLLLADAAGGSKAFADSFTRLMETAQCPLVPAVTPLNESVGQGGKVWMRHVDNLPKLLRPLQVMAHRDNDRWDVLFLPYDLTAAMTGYSNVEPVGLTPESADLFVKALLQWKFGDVLKIADQGVKH
ncbi:MAG: hypothetical protein BIFFINMI_02850 [Phycisphaerae bacterium]|nr:hypothetical protein [Phycisphaerae bacterium]